jgi:signal transduction histidine kinase
MGERQLPGCRRRSADRCQERTNGSRWPATAGGVEVVRRAARGGVEVSVRDTGIGIRQKIWAGCSAHSGVTECRTREGSGLGLYLFRKTAAWQGAKIGVCRNSTKGARSR